MQVTSAKALRGAALLAIMFYAVALLVWPPMGSLLLAKSGAFRQLDPKLFGPLLVGVGVVDYIASLFIEGHLLRSARKSANPGGVVSAAIVTAAFGASLSIYGLLLCHVRFYSWTLYGLCFLHGVHLLLRWPNYAEAARDIAMTKGEEV